MSSLRGRPPTWRSTRLYVRRSLVKFWCSRAVGVIVLAAWASARAHTVQAQFSTFAVTGLHTGGSRPLSVGNQEGAHCLRGASVNAERGPLAACKPLVGLAVSLTVLAVGILPRPRRAAAAFAVRDGAQAAMQVTKSVGMPSCIAEIQEARALEAAARYQEVALELPPDVAVAPVGASFIGPLANVVEKAPNEPVVVLLHGFDSSALEFRRLLPELEAKSIAVHCLDLLGWGFADVSAARDFSPAAKRAHLYAFWQQQLKGRPMVLGGASLGGGIAIDFAVAYPEAVERLVLIDPQGFIDGAPRVGPFGPLGIKLLSSWPLRWLANQMAYFDTETYATDDAIRIGRLHVETENWESANLNYLNSGGYTLSPLVPQVKVPTLLLWGENDGILDGGEQVPRFMSELKGPVQLEWIAECGHVPHLEKPLQTANVIAAWLHGDSS